MGIKLRLSRLDDTDYFEVIVPSFYSIEQNDIKTTCDAKRAILHRYIHNEYVVVLPFPAIGQELEGLSCSPCECEFCVTHTSHEALVTSPGELSQVLTSDSVSAYSRSPELFSDSASHQSAQESDLFCDTESQCCDSDSGTITDIVGSGDLFSDTESQCCDSDSGTITDIVGSGDLFSDTESQCCDSDSGTITDIVGSGDLFSDTESQCCDSDSGTITDIVGSGDLFSDTESQCCDSDSGTITDIVGSGDLFSDTESQCCVSDSTIIISSESDHSVFHAGADALSEKNSDSSGSLCILHFPAKKR